MEKQSVFQRGAGDDDKLGRFVAGSSVSLMATVISGAMSFVWTIAMSRMLGPEGLGFVNPFLTVFWIFSSVVSLGVPQAMTTFISHSNQTDPAESVRVMADGTRLLAMLGLAFCIPGVAGVFLFRGNMGHLMFGLSLLMAAALISRQMYLAIFGLLGGLQRLDILAITNLFFPLSLLISSTGLALLAKKAGADLDAMVLASAAGIPIATTIQYFSGLAFTSRAGAPVREMYRWRNSAPGGTKRLISFGWVTAVGMIAGSAVSFVVPAMVSFLGHNYHFFGATKEINAVQVGYFSGGYNYAMAPMLIVGMVFALLPAVSEAHSDGNHALMKKYFNLAVKYAVTVIAFIDAFYFSYAGRVVEFCNGAKFPADIMGPLTAVLGIGMSLCMMVMLLMNLLIGIKKPGTPAVLAVLFLILEIPVLFLIGKLAGAIIYEAAAFTSVLLMGVIVLGYFVLKNTGLTWPWGQMIRPIVAAVASSAVMSLLPDGKVMFMPGLVILIPVYFIILGWLGGLDEEDFGMLRGAAGEEKKGMKASVLNFAEAFLGISPLSPLGKKKGK